MEVKAIIFDLDGTLLNTIEDIADSMNYALSKSGFKTYPTNDYYYFVGSGVDILTKRVLEGNIYSQKEFNQVKEDYINHYILNQNNKTKPYEGIKEVLTELKKNDIKLAVLSNKPHQDTLNVIDYYFKDTFDVVFGQRENIAIKPDPTTALEILDILNISNKQTIYVGDTNVDMQTAENAKLHSIGVLWGFRTKDELVKANARDIISKPEEILRIVL